MKIKNVIDLHYECFIFELEGSEEEIKAFAKKFKEIFPKKSLLILTERGLI